jgi:hypothetical protein
LNAPLWVVWLSIAGSNILVAVVWYIWNQKNFKKRSTNEVIS